MACDGCSGGCNDCGGLTCGEGVAGIDGLNSFTVTTAQFTVPAISANVTINVSALGQATGIWARVGQEIFIGQDSLGVTAGYYRVVSATATTIVATNTGATGNAAAAATVAIGAGVSPAGRIGVNGADGASELVTLFSFLAANTTGYTPLHTAQTIAADTFATAGDVMRITITSYGQAIHAQNATAYWRYEHKITLGGIDIILPTGSSTFSSTSKTNLNGLFMEIDIMPFPVGATPVFVTSINKMILGYGFADASTGSVVIPTQIPLTQLILNNPYPSGYTTGVAATTTALSFQISGRRTAVGGSPSGTPSLYLPTLKIQMVKK